jgi:hypothetical protein
VVVPESPRKGGGRGGSYRTDSLTKPSEAALTPARDTLRARGQQRHLAAKIQEGLCCSRRGRTDPPSHADDFLGSSAFSPPCLAVLVKPTTACAERRRRTGNAPRPKPSSWRRAARSFPLPLHVTVPASRGCVRWPRERERLFAKRVAPSDQRVQQDEGACDESKRETRFRIGSRNVALFVT